MAGQVESKTFSWSTSNKKLQKAIEKKKEDKTINFSAITERLMLKYFHLDD